MCGINGIINESEGLEKKIKAMNNTVQHRGPDGEGLLLNSNSAIGHKRLAIVDAKNSRADQPMSFENFTITFNGEIYNYKEIRKDLEKKGVSFETECDTEVLLKGYATYGKEILQKINGQFAFAIHNDESGETFLARDRTAIKPLYFSNTDGKLIFSSSPQSILEAGVEFQPDLEAICSQFLAGATFAAGEEPLNNSMYSNIAQLNPGEFAVVNADGNIETRERYFSLPVEDVKVETGVKKEQEIAEYASQIREKLTKSIKDRIAPEVKMGTMLSGGLDSSIVTAVLAEEMKDRELVVSTIRYIAPNMDVNDENTEKVVNTDYHHAKKLVSKLQEKGLNVKFVSHDITPENFLNNLEGMVGALGIHDSIRQLAMFGNYKVLADNGVKVALSGEGADEFNHGYWKAFPGLASDKEKGTCATAKRFKKVMQKRAGFVKSLFNQEAAENIDPKEAGEYLAGIYSSFDTTDPTRKMMGLYAIEFLGFLNKANDRCAMAQSIENRVPYQDREVIDLCLKIPREYQTDVEEGLEKDVLKEAFADKLEGTGILERPKIPLPAAAHMSYHEKVLGEYRKRMKQVGQSFWNYFNKETFENIGNSFEARIDDLMQQYNGDALKAGVELIKWRDIGIDDFDVVGRKENKRYIAGKDIRTNDVFKLLTTMVWYQQNTGGKK